MGTLSNRIEFLSVIFVMFPFTTDYQPSCATKPSVERCFASAYLREVACYVIAYSAGYHYYTNNTIGGMFLVRSSPVL